MTATSYSYPHRHERDEIVDYLAEKFPKCFFSAPNLRRPLKRNIIEDLDRLGVLNTEKLRLAIGWYQSNFTYQRTIIAGAERIDLEGRKAGTVTETEAREARNFIFERKVESEAVKKAAASAVPAPQPPLHLRAVPATDTSNKPALHPSLTAIQAAIDAANRLAGDSTFSGSLRVTLITAALQEVAHAADAAIGVLRDNSTTKED